MGAKIQMFSINSRFRRMLHCFVEDYSFNIGQQLHVEDVMLKKWTQRKNESNSVQECESAIM